LSRRFPPFDPFDRGPFDRQIQQIQIPRPPRRFWLGVGLFGLALLILLITAPLVSFWTETQWYDALGLRSVYLTRVGLQAWLFFGSLIVAFAFAAINAAITLRHRAGPSLRAVGIRTRVYRSGLGVVSAGAAGLIALILSGGAGAQWQAFALFMHSSASGVKDPLYGMDVSFYLMTLPFLHIGLDWLLGLVFMSALLSAVLYTWRGDTFDLRLAAGAIAHLSVLAALLAFILAANNFLGRYDLLYQHNGFVWGAGYTDVNVRAPLAVGRAVLVAVLGLLLLANVVLRRLWLPPAVVAAWVLLALFANVYPAGVQRISVQPSEISQERPYILREIQGTRQAYGLQNVTTQQFAGNPQLTAQAVQDDQATVDNLRLWDTAQLKDVYDQLQTIRTYYTFNDIDVDRYAVAGKTTQVWISARELAPDKLQQQAQSWVNQKLEFTHGYGLAASPVSVVAGEGLPAFVAQDIPPAGPLTISRPQIYFGELGTSYVLAPSAQAEFDYPKGADNVRTTYSGSHGVQMAGFNKTLWSLKTGDFNLLVSPQVQDRTEILYRRNIRDRVSEIAPFLTLDQDPYIVDADGKLYWVMDAYTTASTYPYAQADENSGLGENYIRNSVKVVVDAYEGTVDFYVADSKDPLIRGYQATFPTMFKPLSAMPASLRQHLRVPEDLFKIQTDVYRTYHMDDPSTFYNREDVWDIPAEQRGPNTQLQNLQPYYVTMRLPGQSQPEYLLIMPFTPFHKQNMVGWLAARNDGANYGQLVAYVLPKDRTVFGPQQIANRINQTPAISTDFTLLNQNGSQVILGNLLVVPVGDSFLYFQPFYLRATGTTSIPELKRVILADATNVAYQDTLQKALDQLVGQPVAPLPSGGTGTPTPGPGGSNPQIAQLAQQALQHYNLAQDALKRGDFATYGSEMQQVGTLLQQINQLQSGTTPSPTASPTPRPSASP
jgi:uncharacterized membrane protein (UPF0182 family)